MQSAVFHPGAPACGSCPPGPERDETFMAFWPPSAASCRSGFFFLMQSRYPCHAQTFQVSTNAQPEDIIAAFMVNVILIWASWQMDFKSVLLRVGATTAVVAFLGGKKCCILSSLEICILVKNTYSVFLKVRKGGREHKAARGRKVLFWAPGEFIPFGCFFTTNSPWAKSAELREACSPACCCYPHYVWLLMPKPVFFWVEGVYEVKLQGAVSCFVGKRQKDIWYPVKLYAFSLSFFCPPPPLRTVHLAQT